MTNRNQQMYDDFQMVYNNLASNLAPGLDIFEISMYLTKAYYSFVTSTYVEYEKSEAARKALIQLVKTKNISPTSTTDEKVSKESVFFELPEDLLFVVYEQITVSNSSDVPTCLRDKTVLVTPISHDDFHQVYNNPFRFNKRHAIRLDFESGSKRIAEIIYVDSHISNYKVRYIRKPKPIILDDLTGTDRIDNEQAHRECELNPIYDKDIVSLAAQMAYKDYKAA